MKYAVVDLDKLEVALKRFRVIQAKSIVLEATACNAKKGLEELAAAHGLALMNPTETLKVVAEALAAPFDDAAAERVQRLSAADELRCPPGAWCGGDGVAACPIHGDLPPVVPLPHVGQAVVTFDRDTIVSAMAALDELVQRVDKGEVWERITYVRQVLDQAAMWRGQSLVPVPPIEVDRRLMFRKPEQVLAFVDDADVYFDETKIDGSSPRHVFVDGRFFDDHTSKEYAVNTSILGSCGLPALYMKIVNEIEVLVLEGELVWPLELNFMYGSSDALKLTYDAPGRLSVGRLVTDTDGDESWEDELSLYPLESWRVVVTAPNQPSGQVARVRVNLHGPLARPARKGEEALPFEHDNVSGYGSLTSDLLDGAAEDLDLDPELRASAERGIALMRHVWATDTPDPNVSIGGAIGLLYTLGCVDEAPPIEESLEGAPPDLASATRRFVAKAVELGLVQSDEHAVRLTDGGRDLLKTVTGLGEAMRP